MKLPKWYSPVLALKVQKTDLLCPRSIAKINLAGSPQDAEDIIGPAPVAKPMRWL